MSDELIENDIQASAPESIVEQEVPTRQEIGEDIRAARKAASLSAAEARKLLGLDDVKKVYRYEAGERIPGLQMTIQMSQVYNSSLKELFPNLWNFHAKQIVVRRQKLTESHRDPGFRNAPRGRRANWELEEQQQEELHDEG